MAKRIIIREMLDDDDILPVNVSEAEGASGRLRFTAMVQRGEHLNRNRRVYPADELRRAFGQLNENIQRGYGAVDHPSNGKGSVSDIGIRWLRFFEQGADWYGEGEVVPTQKGRDLAAVIEAGLPIGFSSRGFADFEEAEDEQGRPYRRVKNLELITVDAVTSPSVVDARIQTFTREEQEQMELEEQLAAANERVTALEADVAERDGRISQLEGELEAARAEGNESEQLRERISTLESELARVAATEAENKLTARLNELTEGHRYAATIIAEARELGVTLETAEKVIPRLTKLVEAVAATSNEGASEDEGSPKGDLSTDEDAEPVDHSAGLSDDQQEELKAAGL